MLTENRELVLKDNKITDTFNEYFETIVEDLDLYYWKGNSELLSNTKSFVKSIILSQNAKIIQA